jgi:chemosensory pili system protein ChpA (sensor histidine kinase/response regulator)
MGHTTPRPAAAGSQSPSLLAYPAGDTIAKVSHKGFLLIDDSSLALDFQARLLKRSGFESRTCTGLDELEQALTDFSPQAVVCDADLGESTSQEVIEELRRHPQTAHVPIVLCSGLPLEELAALAQETGADGYVSKSENIRELPNVLRRLCGEQ